MTVCRGVVDTNLVYRTSDVHIVNASTIYFVISPWRIKFAIRWLTTTFGEIDSSAASYPPKVVTLRPCSAMRSKTPSPSPAHTISARDERGETDSSGDSRYASLIERIGYGIYRSSPQGRFVEVNSALVTMLGYATADDVYALDLARDVYLDPDERDRLLQRSPSTDYPAWVESRWKRRDGSAIAVKLSVRPIVDSAGELTFYDGIVEDITERQRHDELLRRSERMASLGTTLAGVAHELNNPLAAVMGFAQLLLKKPWPAEDRAALETINHEAIRSATIVKDLLTMARKRDNDRRTATDVNDIVGYIVRTRRYQLETAGIVCSVQLEPNLPLVRGDRAQLEQVMRNLLNNAEHALGARIDGGREDHPPQLKVRTRHDDQHVIIEVEDNGPGVPEDTRMHIWDPFWTTKEEGEGTGLGLAVVHAIVAEHGGHVSVSDTVASGARFEVRLPIAKDTGTLPAPVAQAPRPLDVLVVDPGAVDLIFVERLLTLRGHAVINAASGELAVRLAHQTSFDAVVCDARLTGRDGRLVAATLRETPGCADARFVLSTPAPLDGEARPAAIGDAVLVVRPYDVEELRRLIEGD
jgi:two-component system, cell cycle sensor histidine kinase and response regulator CckA